MIEIEQFLDFLIWLDERIECKRRERSGCADDRSYDLLKTEIAEAEVIRKAYAQYIYNLDKKAENSVTHH